MTLTVGRRGALALVAVACLSLAFLPGGPKSERKRYLAVVDAWTRELVLYFGVETALILRGTYLSGPFRSEMAEERRRMMNPDPDAHAEHVARQQQDLQRWHEVVFSADSGIDDADRFGQDDRGWILRLEADGVPQPLDRIDRIRKPTPVQRALFPHYNIWSDLWIARFERTVAAPDAVVLHVGSGYGHGRLRWEQLNAR